MKLNNLLLAWSPLLLCVLTTFSLSAQSISGIVLTADGEAMEGITIKVNDESVLTESSGAYTFFNLNAATNYTVKPSKEETNLMNGVNMFDVVVLHKHILGIAPFSSPYQKVAADVNGSGTITSMDVVKMRRMILRVDLDFGDLDAWRFIDANFDMDNGNLAQIPEFPEERLLDALVAGSSSIDFKGIKLGDVNFSATTNFNNETEERNQETLHLTVENETEDDYTTVRFRARDFMDIAALQFTLNYSAADLEFVTAKSAELSNFTIDNLGLDFQEEGKLTIAWQNAETITLTDDEVLFQLIFKNKQSRHSNETMYISSDITPALAFRASGEEWKLAGEQLYLSNTTEKIQLENFPNPFYNETTVRFSMLENGLAQMNILTSTGQVIKSIQGVFSKGDNELMITKEDLNGHNGLLFLQLNIDNKTIMKKIMFSNLNK